MSQSNEREQRQRQQELPSLAAPEDRDTEEREAQREVVIEKSHVERPAVRGQRQKRKDEPGRALRSRAHQGEGPPEENQDAKRHHDGFGGVEAGKRSDGAQQQVE